MKLQDKVVLITGAAGGIGRATAIACASEGAMVVLADCDTSSLPALIDELGKDVADYTGVDVSDEAQVKSMVSFAVERFGKLDVFIANAGTEGKIGDIIDSDVDNLDRVYAVNVRGVWLGLKYAIEVMKDSGGSIIITSSGAGLKGMAGMVPYTTSKHAVMGMMRSAALECTKYNIRVNSVNPGPVDTQMMRAIEAGYNPDDSESVKSQIEAIVPMGRYAQPDEVAKMMVFLASDDSCFCTGSFYMVDGGGTA